MSYFWVRARKLDVPHEQLLAAVSDLTRADKREADPPRYELREHARKACWQLRGPPLDSKEEMRRDRQR